MQTPARPSRSGNASCRSPFFFRFAGRFSKFHVCFPGRGRYSSKLRYWLLKSVAGRVKSYRRGILSYGTERNTTSFSGRDPPSSNQTNLNNFSHRSICVPIISSRREPSLGLEPLKIITHVPLERKDSSPAYSLPPHSLPYFPCIIHPSSSKLNRGWSVPCRKTHTKTERAAHRVWIDPPSQANKRTSELEANNSGDFPYGVLRTPWEQKR
ncbi:hypothetical protein B0T21DRAFT_105213 [Apiosordaria backusii]|uniref:Uncharacterized protein n=1 Tax=Apiosordaria backusii TaxID=314023 RepID=A0AA40DIA0_9PEZI|nr:hypothetical protein B0T21DRAFT_105213 [Apiosordaria backusii]